VSYCVYAGSDELADFNSVAVYYMAELNDRLKKDNPPREF
jgi:hypothetical protein